MFDRQLRAVLHGLGIDEETCHALLLLPLVQVAWADGRIQDRERALILQVAHERGLLTEDGERLLEGWLAYPPSERYLARGRMVLVELAHQGAGADAGLTPRSLRDVVGFCEDVARAAGGIFDRWRAVSEDERRAIDAIAEALDLDQERNWGELFGDLDGGGLPVSTGPAPAEPIGDELDYYDATDVDGVPLPLGELAGTVDPGLDVDDAEPLALASEQEGPRVVLVSGEGDPAVYTLDGGAVRVGRRPDCEIQVRWDGQVSRVHCRLHERGGRWTVFDAGSANGTWVEGERVLSRRLFGGEEIRVGQTRFLFQI